MKSNILIKFKLLKKQFDYKNYFNKYDFSNHFKWLSFSTIIKILSFLLKILNIINELNTLIFNIIEYEIKLLIITLIWNTFSLINILLIILLKYFIKTNSNYFIILSI